jgi:hypothetical protein
LSSFGPADAARPLLDTGQWDAYFALFARDVSVPWKPATIRLDTYSGAPLDFAAYAVDPAEVIIAGQNRAARALDTARFKAITRWRYSPPAGLRFESQDVTVPLGSQEGFYVIEARRGDAVQQIWLNRTHIGLVTKESPEGLMLWGVDLHSGRPLAGMNVEFLVGLKLIERKTDASGLITWRERLRPSFALAESGAGRAFVSLLPQAPVPANVVGLRLESAVARAGQSVRFVGFARHRLASEFRKTSGEVRVALLGRGKTLASTNAKLDANGAFEGTVVVPAGLDAGDYALLATAAGGGVGGTSLHVDAVADVALAVRNGCPCDPSQAVPLSVVATRAGEPATGVEMRVEVVRSPHVVPPGGSGEPRWGTTVVFNQHVRTDASGVAAFVLPPPTDGLDSTYGIRAGASGASATSRVVVANTSVALSVEPDAASVDVGQPVSFEVRGFDAADGTPSDGLAVRLRLSHGTNSQSQDVQLDARGRAHVSFAQPNLGSNMALAEAVVDGKHALDAAAVVVEPSALSGSNAPAVSDVLVLVDRTRYKPVDRIAVRASIPGAAGDALITLEGARTYQARLAGVSRGDAGLTLDASDPQGDVRVGAAFVRDGAIALGTIPLHIDGPGRARASEITLDRATYAAGDTLRATLHDGPGHDQATYAIRISDARESGGALFDDAPDVLVTGGTTSQNPAGDNPAWHSYVAPASSKASDIFAAERARKVPTEPPSIGAAAPRTMFWRIQHDGGPFDIPVPSERGRYVLSIMKIAADGDVGAASAAFSVQ